MFNLIRRKYIIILVWCTVYYILQVIPVFKFDSEVCEASKCKDCNHVSFVCKPVGYFDLAQDVVCLVVTKTNHLAVVHPAPLRPASLQQEVSFSHYGWLELFQYKLVSTFPLSN